MVARLWRGGMVGAGVWSENQLNAWAQVSNAKIVALCDRDTERLAHRSKQFEIENTFSSVEFMLDEMELDFIDLCVRPASHAPLTRLGAERGLPVLCQKPFCTSLDEAKETVAFCENADARLMINENFRWQPWFRAAKMVLDDGAIGDPFYAQIRWRLRMSLPKFHHEQTYFAEMPRLAVYELGVHYLDVYRFLFGEPDTLYARLQRISSDVVGEDVQNVMLGYDERNLTCQILHSWASLPIPNHDTVPDAHPWAVAHPFIIEGTKGTLHLEPDRTMHLYTESDHEIWEFEPEARHTGRAGALQHFINCLDSGEAFETSGADTLKTMALVYACYESSEKKQVIRPQELL